MGCIDVPKKIAIIGFTKTETIRIRNELKKVLGFPHSVSRRSDGSLNIRPTKKLAYFFNASQTAKIRTWIKKRKFHLDAGRVGSDGAYHMYKIIK